ncbi:LLM class F420-dependent oxidoreductase [Microtetraspora sp. NBRC 13810]|uniref:TIGR03564 family F420-dependent LLM class oxidoreductase n=1 Tax=Microtetraspora sp. NBRC 13810 TaxID=3030990 RepID=UPI0024A4CA8C|nr:TIGR03564 family F420-dependent LLM class oxidoreductase [Microtetraspora sp. NBRC 13810]GLW05160.1 LLM class F420-dependent oxidoreductase [Microtetraspora sp. NBRC 13810]
MRIGVWFDDSGMTVDEICRRAGEAAKAGYDVVWRGETGSWDPLTMLAVMGREVPGVGLGTAVVRSYPRHPLALAAQALTVQAAVGNRLRLGLGPGHAAIIEGQYGLPFTGAVDGFREYLEALLPLLRGEEVAYRGRSWTAVGEVGVVGARPPAVLVSALGPRMLRLAGELSDGTVTTWLGPAGIADYVAPALAEAARAAGRPAPEVIAGVCVAVTGDPDGARSWVNERYGRAGDLPSYRAVMDREGARTPGDTIIAGDEAAVERELRRFADAGAAEVQVIPVGTPEEQERVFTLAPQLVAASR